MKRDGKQRVTHPDKRAKPVLFALVTMPDVRIAPNNKKPSTMASFPAALSINESAIIGQSNIRLNVMFTKMSSARRIFDSE